MFNGSFYGQNDREYPVLSRITTCYSIDHQVKPKTYDETYQKLTECDYGGVKIVKYRFCKCTEYAILLSFGKTIGKPYNIW